MVIVSRTKSDVNHIIVSTSSGKQYTLPIGLNDREQETVVAILEALENANITLNTSNGQISINFK